MKSMVYEQGDKRVASSVMHKVISGQHPNLQGYSFDAMVTEKIINNAFDRYWSKLAVWSAWLGNATSTALGIYIIVRVVKFAVDTLIHGKILYDIYGLGWQLMASFWDSLTNFLSHRSNLKPTAMKDELAKQDIIKAEEGIQNRVVEPRTKCTRQLGNITIGTMVLVKEDNLPPSKWCLGRIIQIIKGADDNIRVVIIKTKDGEFKRSISK
uniref:DUF5641 domain-containing protein n=1 Tax=Anopheles dirus TaxID=7168 RepID=A0A182NPV4_9DIPT